jgi:hypothetical protein
MLDTIPNFNKLPHAKNLTFFSPGYTIKNEEKFVQNQIIFYILLYQYTKYLYQ